MVVILCNCGAEQSEELARALVGEGLAACVNVLPGVTSVYVWEGRVCVEGEHTLLIKTTRARAAELSARLRDLHAYDVPEILVLDVDEAASDPRYVAWARRAVEPGQEGR